MTGVSPMRIGVDRESAGPEAIAEASNAPAVINLLLLVITSAFLGFQTYKGSGGPEYRRLLVVILYQIQLGARIDNLTNLMPPLRERVLPNGNNANPVVTSR